MNSPYAYPTPVFQQQQQQPQQEYYNIQSRGTVPIPPPPPPSSSSPSNMYLPPQAQPAALRHPPTGGGGSSGSGLGAHRPPFVDPDTHMVYETANAEYEGWLTKQSVWLKEWRRRYFILKGSKLFFARNEYSAPHGMMDLASCTTVKSADIKSKKRHSFEISTPETQYLLYADTESQKDDWIGRVGKAIVRCSRTYYDNSHTNNHHYPGGPSGHVGQYQQHQQATDAAQREVYQYNEDDDDIYTNDDPNNPYFND